MRKIVVSQFITLDGVMEAPEQWNRDYIKDEPVTRDILAGFAASDLLILGRTTYEFFAERWPLRTGEMADWFNSVRKYVVSTNLKIAGWNNSQIIHTTEEIKNLQAQPGKDILILGSYKLIQGLMRENIVNEFRLYVYPLIVGTGKRLFEEEAGKQELKLMDAQVFSSGVIRAIYQSYL